MLPPRNLEQLVAHATGESIREIRRRGFTLVDQTDADCDSESADRRPRIVDWDRLQAKRLSLFP